MQNLKKSNRFTYPLVNVTKSLKHSRRQWKVKRLRNGESPEETIEVKVAAHKKNRTWYEEEFSKGKKPKWI